MLKVMIVDDERNIRDGIMCLIDWAGLGCNVETACANGSIAYEYLQSHPIDIVVTDIKMPVMNGLELSKKIAQEFPGIQVVILTAYSDFEMAKEAIRYGVKNFIVKNDFMEELPATIKELAENIQKTEKKNDFSLQGYRYCVCACEVESLDEAASYNYQEMLNNILTIALKECIFYMVPKSDAYMNIVIKYPQNSDIGLNTIVEYFNNILIMVEEFMRINLRIGLSSEEKEPEACSKVTKEAEEALSKIISEGSSLSVYVMNEESGSDIELVDIEKYKLAICDCAFSESEEESKNLLAKWGEELLEKGICFEQCQLYALVIYSAMIHKAVSYHLDIERDFNEMEKEVYKKIQNAKTLYGLIEVGKETLRELRGLCVGKMHVKNELVKRVDDCIRQHYKDELNLNFISNTLYLNGSYVSRAYKKLTGITVTEKINLFRIGKAKELLKNSNKKIYEIADEVGFNDPAYFTNVFLKYCGESPSEYRMEK